MVKDLAILLFKIGAVKFGKFKLTSGLESPFYIDLRTALSYPEAYRLIVDYYSSMLNGVEFDKIAGVETAGIPWASMLAYRLGKGLIYVRKEAKQHGAGRLIEGHLNPGERVVVVDDVLTTGGSITSAVRAIKGSGGIVELALVAVDREQGGVANVKAEGVEVRSIVKVTELMEILYREGYIEFSQYLEVLKYLGKA